jgi:hypothetical protein
MKPNVFEKLQEYELRINKLSERAVEVGKLEERKRLADKLYNEYQEVFKTDRAFADKLYLLIDRVLEDD